MRPLPLCELCVSRYATLTCPDCLFLVCEPCHEACPPVLRLAAFRCRSASRRAGVRLYARQHRMHHAIKPSRVER